MTRSPWRKSSRSAGGANNCVETRKSGRLCQVRDSKLGNTSPTLDMSTNEFTSLLNLLGRLQKRLRSTESGLSGALTH